MAQPKILVYICDRWKNINTKIRRNLLTKDVGYVGTNLRYSDEFGSLSKRLSRAKWNTASLTVTPFKGMYRYYKNSNDSVAMLVAYDGKVSIGYDAAGVLSELKTGLSTYPVSFLTYKDFLYMFNGSDANQVFTMSVFTDSFTTMGVPSTIVPVATISVATGNLLGSVYYATSFRFDGYQEGSIGPSTTTTNVNGSQATISLAISTNPRCDGRYLYRTKSSSSVLYRVATVSDNSTSAYIDNIADTSLDTTIIGPIDYGIPASYKYPCLHASRVFLGWNKTYKSRIIYSDVRSGASYPDVFPSSNYLRISEDDGDEITFLKEDHLGQMIVSKTNSIRIINTNSDSPLSWYFTDPVSNQGCVAPLSAITTPMGIVYLTRYGENKKRLVLWNGSDTVLIPELEGIEPILSAIPDTGLEYVVGHYHSGFYYLTYRDVLGAGLYPNRVLVIDIYNGWATAIDKKNISCFSSWNSGKDRGELYTGTSDNTGFIYREDTSAYDFLLKTQTELDEGTHSGTDAVGTEVSPSLTLTSGVAGGLLAAKSWSQMGPWASMSGYNDCWWNKGQWVGAVRDISAEALASLYWNEKKTANTDVNLWVRTGNTIGACETASWNGPYSTPEGSDISAVTAAKYIQVKANLLTKFYANMSETAIFRSGTGTNDYVIKISANYGAAAESTIEFDFESGQIDLGDVNEAFRRLRKRLRSVRIEYEAGSSAGNFDFKWYLNGSSTQAGSFNTSFTTYSSARSYNFPLSNFCDDFIYRIFSDSDTSRLVIKRIVFVISVEPLKILQRNL